MQPRVPTIRAKKTATRMRKKSANASSPSPDRKQQANKSALQLINDHAADTSVDSFIDIQEMSMHDDDDTMKHSPHRKTFGGAGGGEGRRESRKSDASLDLDLSVTAEEEERISEEELRGVFEQSLGADEFLAEKG